MASSSGGISRTGTMRPAPRRLIRTQTAGNLGESTFDDLSEVVPSSLADITPILRVANEVEASNPRVAYLCEFFFFLIVALNLLRLDLVSLCLIGGGELRIWFDFVELCANSYGEIIIIKFLMIVSMSKIREKKKQREMVAACQHACLVLISF